MNCENDGIKAYPSLCFIVNPASHSGKGMKLWKQAEHILKEKNIPYEVFLSQKRGDIAAYARLLTESLKEDSERTLVMLGGDGTVNEALQGIQNFERVRLGVYSDRFQQRSGAGYGNQHGCGDCAWEHFKRYEGAPDGSGLCFLEGKRSRTKAIFPGELRDRI